MNVKTLPHCFSQILLCHFVDALPHCFRKSKRITNFNSANNKKSDTNRKRNVAYTSLSHVIRFRQKKVRNWIYGARNKMCWMWYLSLCYTALCVCVQKNQINDKYERTFSVFCGRFFLDWKNRIKFIVPSDLHTDRLQRRTASSLDQFMFGKHTKNSFHM